ncbi:MAG: TetR/AcrR family transcriptional regulator, partial [Lachnospiraceae bacterium]
MANRVEGVTEKLLHCARQEFLSKGYLGASMRVISENAGTTPRSIYTRYGDKEGLFAALVGPAADQLKKTFCALQEQYHQRPEREQKQLFEDLDFRQEYDGYLTVIMDQIYENLDAFKLLVCHSEGTGFAGFVDEMVALDEKYTLLYIEHTQNDVLTSGRAKPQLIHLLCSSFMHGFYEFVRHDMPREEAIEY